MDDFQRRQLARLTGRVIVTFVVGLGVIGIASLDSGALISLVFSFARVG